MSAKLLDFKFIHIQSHEIKMFDENFWQVREKSENIKRKDVFSPYEILPIFGFYRTQIGILQAF